MRHCEVRDGLLVMKMSSILFCLVGVVIICSVCSFQHRMHNKLPASKVIATRALTFPEGPGAHIVARDAVTRGDRVAAFVASVVFRCVRFRRRHRSPSPPPPALRVEVRVRMKLTAYLHTFVARRESQSDCHSARRE